MISPREKKAVSRLFRKGEKGQAQVEFALTIVFVLLLVFGIIELIMLIYTYNVLADSAKEGVRAAIVHGSSSASSDGLPAGSTSNNATSASAPDVWNAVQNTARLSFHDVSGMTITVNYPDSVLDSSTGIYSKPNDPPNRVRVTISYPFRPLFGFGWPSVTVRAASEGRIAY